MAKFSINEILGLLRDFDKTRMMKSLNHSGYCVFCDQNWGSKVQDAISKVSDYFDGLCLDCLRRSKDTDTEYWSLCGRDWDRYDDACRVSHGEPTHYFSFMGSRERRGLVGRA